MPYADVDDIQKTRAKIEGGDALNTILNVSCAVELNNRAFVFTAGFLNVLLLDGPVIKVAAR